MSSKYARRDESITRPMTEEEVYYSFLSGNSKFVSFWEFKKALDAGQVHFETSDTIVTINKGRTYSVDYC